MPKSHSGNPLRSVISRTIIFLCGLQICIGLASFANIRLKETGGWSLDFAKGMAQHGNYIYVSDSIGLRTLFCDGNLIYQTSMLRDYSSSLVWRHDNYLYASSQYKGLHVLDISEPHQPQPLGEVLTTRAIRHMKFFDDLAVLNVDYNLAMYQIVSPTEMRQIYTSTEGSIDFERKENIAYVQHYDDIRLYDITDTQHVFQVGSIPIENSRGIARNGDYLYSFGSNFIRAYDISIPNLPIFVGESSYVSRTIYELFFIDGEIIQIFSEQNAAPNTDPLHVERSQLTAPVYLEPLWNEVVFEASCCWPKHFLMDNNFLILQFRDHIKRYDLSAPTLYKTSEFRPQGLHSFEVQDQFVYIAGELGLSILERDQRGYLIERAGFEFNLNRWVNAIYGDYWFVTSEDNGELVWLDVSDPSNPMQVGHRSTLGDVTQIFMNEGIGLVSQNSPDGTELGVEVLDLSSLPEVTSLGMITGMTFQTMVSHANGLFLRERYSSGSKLLDVYQFDNNYHVIFQGSAVIPYGYYEYKRMIPSEGQVYVVTKDGILAHISLEDPTHPATLKWMFTDWATSDLGKYQNYCIVSESSDLVVYLENPYFQQIQTIHSANSFGEIEIEEDYCFTQESGVTVFRMEDCMTSPALDPEYLQTIAEWPQSHLLALIDMLMNPCP